MVTKIGVIGGGPAGVSFCMQFKKKLIEQGLNKNIEIIVFEKSSHIGHGQPYKDNEDCHILNLPKSVMEPLPNGEVNFANWCQKNAPMFEHTAFPPRHLFGKYLEEQAIQTQIEAECSNLKITYLVKQEVIDIKELENSKYHVITNNEDYEVDFVMLSLGHMPSSNFKHLKNKKGYIHNSWDINQLKSIDPNASVHIIGTRLSAIDVALKLEQLNHKGTIYMSSRSGLLPTVLGKDVAPYNLKYLTKEAVLNITNDGEKKLSLKKLSVLFWKEMKFAFKENTHLTSVPESIKNISMIDWINNEIQEASTGSRLWQSILFALYPITPFIWSFVEEDGKVEFMEKYNSLFITYLAAFPLDNAYKIKKMLESGKLKIFGGLEQVDYHNNSFYLHYSDKEDIAADYVINATGPGYDASEIPCLSKMMSSSLVLKHDFGGIHINGNTCQVICGGNSLAQKMYAVGEVTKGQQFFTTDLGCVTAQMDIATRHLMHSLKEGVVEVTN